MLPHDKADKARRRFPCRSMQRPPAHLWLLCRQKDSSQSQMTDTSTVSVKLPMCFLQAQNGHHLHHTMDYRSACPIDV
eukprot:487933-Amphidinium_carterae.1